MPSFRLPHASFMTILGFFACHLVYWLLVGGLFRGPSIGEALYFSAITLIYVLGPGLAVASLLGGSRLLGRGLSLFFLSFLFGFGWLIFALISAVAWELPALLMASPLLSGLLLAPSLRRRLSWALPPHHLLAVSYALIVFAGVMFPFIAYLLPLSSYSQAIHINQDLLWEMGISLSLTRSFPPEDFQMAGLPFSYHYFVHAFLAAFYKLLPGTSMETLYLRLFPFLFAEASAMGVVSLALRSKIKGYRLLLLLFVTALWNAGEFNLAVNFNMMISAFAFSCLFLLGMFHIISRKEASGVSLLALGLLAFLGAGCKISLIPVLAAGLACELGVCLLTTRRLCLTTLTQLTTVAVAGGLAWLLAFRPEARFALWLKYDPLSIAAQTLKQTDLPTKSLHYSWHLIKSFYPLLLFCFVPLLAPSPMSPRGRRWWRIAAFSMVAGIIASLVFGHEGGSQSHFQIYGLYCVPFLLLSWFRSRHPISQLVLALLAGHTLIVGLHSRFDTFTVHEKGMAQHLSPNAPYPYYLNRITRGSMEVMAYIRKFSHPDSILAHHPLPTWPGYDRYFYFTALAERRSLLSGPEYSAYGNIRRFQGVERIRELAKLDPYFDSAEQRYHDLTTLFYADNVEAVKQVIARQSFDILIHPKELNLLYDWSEVYDKVMENEDLVLYQVKGKKPFGTVPPYPQAVSN